MAKGDKGESRKNLVSRREFLLGGGAVIAATALAACTPKTTTLTSTTTKMATATTIATSTTTIAATTPTKTATETTTNQTTQTPTSTPKYGGTLRAIRRTPAGIGWPAEQMGGDAVTDLLVRDTSFIPVYEGGSGLAFQPFVMDTGCGERSLAIYLNFERIWLKK